MSDTEFLRPEFGTDGLRGRAGAPPMDPETLRRVAAGLGIWLQRQGGEQKRVLVANDGRESADWILEALAQGLCATDAAVHDAGLLTTPALAHLVRNDSTFTAGIMISASHNPSPDNGVKIFQGNGSKLPDGAEQEIANLTTEIALEPPLTHNVRPRPELRARYEEHLVNLFDLDLSGKKIVVDAANGGGSEIAPVVLSGFGAEVLTVGCEPDGDNINDGVGALHPGHLAAAVISHGADFGICLDGDGDRGMFADERGMVRDGDEVLAALGPELLATGRLPGKTVVATVMSNLALQKSLAQHGIAVHQTAVGDRAVVAAMREQQFGLGGEQSGHIIFSGIGQLTGDGLFTALELLQMATRRNVGFAEAFGSFVRFPQLLVNVPVSHKPNLQDLTTVQDAVRKVEAALGDDGRVVLRYSGTEDLCRVMVEGPDEATVQQHTEQIAEAVRSEIGR